jgi:hypothetical protein
MMRPLFFMLCLVTGSALAQEAPPLVRAQPEEPPPASFKDPRLTLVPGEEVRIKTSTRELSGSFTLLDPGALSLQVEPDRVERLLVADIQQLSVRRRAVLPGLFVGGGIGAAVVGGYGVLACLIIGEGQSSTIGVAACGLVGALLGSLIGGGVGALVGLALPRWPTLYEREEQGGRSPRLATDKSPPSTLQRWLFHPGPLGELGVQFEYAGKLRVSQPDWGPGVRLQLLARLGEHFTLGPEAALHARVGTDRFSGPGGTFTQPGPLFQLGGTVRAGMRLDLVRPALIAGLGWYLGQFSHVGASVGAEVEVHAVEGIPVVFEVRYHDNLQSLAGPDPSYLSFGVGSQLAW